MFVDLKLGPRWGLPAALGPPWLCRRISVEELICENLLVYGLRTPHVASYTRAHQKMQSYAGEIVLGEVSPEALSFSENFRQVMSFVSL